jgi:DNA-binding GntR family transcriptional regulator
MQSPLTSNTAKNGSVSAKEKAYDYLKANILSGDFSPGERLTEEHLARQLGMSRTPVREALHKLDQEGLIKPLETRGFSVSFDSKEEIEELFDIRASLEPYALRLICKDISEETLVQLNGFIEKAEDAFRRERTDEIFTWNTRFHDTLYNLIAHKRRFYSMIANVREYVLRYRKDTLYYLRAARRTIDGHRKIILALRLRDPEVCEWVMRQHIHEAREDAMQTISEMR